MGRPAIPAPTEAAITSTVADKSQTWKGSKRRTGRCLRFKAMRGGFTKTGAQGANSFRFTGRLRGKALKAGPYRLRATATDLAANQADAVRLRFAVRR